MRLRRSNKIKTLSRTSIIKWLWTEFRNIELKLIALLILSYLFIYSELSSAQEAATTITDQSAAGDKLSGTWKLKLSGGQSEEGLDSETIVDFVINPNLKYKLNDNLHINADLALLLNSSQQQSRFQKESGARVGFNELVANYNIGDKIDVQAGAVNQGFLRDSLVISKYRAFPGVKGVIHLGKGSKSGIKGSISATSAVPTSSTLNSNLSEKEATPSFVAQAFTLEKPLNFSKQNDFAWMVSGGHYKYTSLPAVVAEKSSYFGNTTNGELSSGARFIYDFDGGFVAGKFGVMLNRRFEIYGRTHMVQNFEAPDRFNRGGLNQVGITVGARDRYTFYLSQGFMESDVAPTYYMSNWGGFANREVRSFGIAFESKASSYKVLAELSQSDEINDVENQDQINSFLIKLETTNVSF